MIVCIYEDNEYSGFGPLTDTRAVWDLRIGAFTFAERLRFQIQKLQPDLKVFSHSRKHLSPLYTNTIQACTANHEQSEPIIGINGRAVFTFESLTSLLILLLNSSHDTLYVHKGESVAFHLDEFGENDFNTEFFNPFKVGRLSQQQIPPNISVELFRYPWELINKSSDSTIYDDFDFLQEIYDPIEINNDQKYPIRLEKYSRLGPGVILDANEGPIIIAHNAVIEAGAIIQGPAYIGPYSIIRPGATLEKVYLGPHCRVGGEVSNCIMQEYSNKQHSGYVGNSYIGSWVNLGAATDTSDLKNNYRPVTVSINGKMIETGSNHVGSIIGDFVKTAIHTRLNTGTVVGVCCNLFGIDFPPKEVPPFTWVGSDGMQPYRFDKALETIRTQVPRRKQMDDPNLDCEFTPEWEAVLRHVFEQQQGAV